MLDKHRLTGRDYEGNILEENMQNGKKFNQVVTDANVVIKRSMLPH